ncbi:hypothetical protein BW39_03831 [Delftia sp. RIT313]|nr:hypothetical protein BW39_03831 [Delftia sp. RIT313]
MVAAQRVVPLHGVVAGEDGIGRAVVDHELGAPVAQHGQLAVVGREHEGQRAFGVQRRRGLDLGQHAVHAACQRELRAVEAGRVLGWRLPDQAHGAGVQVQRVGEFPAGPAGRIQPCVIREAAVDAAAAAGGGALEQAGNGALLLGAEAAAVARAAAGGHVARQVEARLAGCAGLHHAVGGAVQRIAPGQHGLADQAALGLGEARAQVGGRGGQLRIALGAGNVGNGRQRQARAGVAGNDAVVLVGIARGRHHGVAPAVGAAAQVGAVRPLAIGRLQRAARHGRELAHGLVAVVQPRLRVQAEQGAHAACMPGVGAEHGKAHLQRIAQRPAAQGSHGRAHDAVQPAVGLVEKAPVPVARQAHLEAHGVVLTIDGADALVHAAGHSAVLGNGLACHRQRAGCHGLGGGDAGVGEGYFRGQVRARQQRGGAGLGQLRDAVARAAAGRQQQRGKGGGQRGRQGAGTGLVDLSVHVCLLGRWCEASARNRCVAAVARIRIAF